MTRSRGEPIGPGVAEGRGMESGAAPFPHAREALPGSTWDDGVCHRRPISAWRSGGPVNPLNLVPNQPRAVQRQHSFQSARKARPSRSRLPRARPDPPARLIPPTTNASQYHLRTVPVGGSSACFQMFSPSLRRPRNGSSANSDSGIGPKRHSVTSRRDDSFGGVESRLFIPHDSCCSTSR